MDDGAEGGPRNPYSLIELVLRQKVDWSKVKNLKLLLETIFNLDFEHIIRPGKISPIYGSLFLKDWMDGLSGRWEQIYELIGVGRDRELFDLARGLTFGDCANFNCGKIRTTDPIQRIVKNCGLIASIGSIAWVNPGNILCSMDSEGRYLLSYYHDHGSHSTLGCHCHDVCLHGKILKFNDEIYGAKSSCEDECWPSLYEKELSLTIFIDPPIYNNHPHPVIPDNHAQYIDPHDSCSQTPPNLQNEFYNDELFYYPGNTNLIQPRDVLFHLTGKKAKKGPGKKIIDYEGLFSPLKKIQLGRVPVPLIWSIPNLLGFEREMLFAKADVPIVASTYQNLHDYNDLNISSNHAYSVLGLFVEKYSGSNYKEGDDIYDDCKDTHVDILVRNPYGKNDCTGAGLIPGVRYYLGFDGYYIPIKHNMEVMKDGVFGVDLKHFPKLL